MTVTATDVAADSMTASTTGLPDNLSLTDNGCSTSDGTHTCTWTLSGIMDEMAGEYTVRVTVADDDSGQTDTDITVQVLKEITLLSVADASVQYSDSVILSATLTDDDGTPLAGKTMHFAVAGACDEDGATDANGVATVTCGPVPLALGWYDIVVSFDGEAGYYQAATGSATLSVTAEGASVHFDRDNPLGPSRSPNPTATAASSLLPRPSRKPCPTMLLMAPPPETSALPRCR